MEAPSFGIPTLNIGNRQKGRTRGESVIDVEASYQEMYLGLQKALSENFRAIASAGKNPYEKENTLQAIFNVIENHPLHNIGEKHFYDL